ncbi:MAG TPA: hypothetical protein VM368_02640, partial [Flavisolibacter sp.]|nr:hypothetical protein [Flavisolibacter sp.]
MKNLLIYASILCTLFTSCQDGNSSESSSEKKGQKKISKRDYSITKENSYSTLFFDSSAMEKYIIDKAVPDSIARRLRSFYNTRNYQFAWFSDNGLTEQARAFWNLHDYVTTYDNDTSLKDKDLQKRMEALIAEESLSVSASPTFINTEIKLTEHFIKYMLNNYQKGYVKRKEMERFVPFKKRDPMELADSLLTKKHNDDKYFEDVHEPYRLLKEQLQLYYNIAKAGGWPQITSSAKSIKKGTSSLAVPLIKRRLQLTGQMPGNDTTQVF